MQTKREEGKEKRPKEMRRWSTLESKGFKYLRGSMGWDARPYEKLLNLNILRP